MNPFKNKIMNKSKQLLLISLLSSVTSAAVAAPFVNLRQHPMGLFSETLDLDLDIYINNAWSVGPSVRYSIEPGYEFYWADKLDMKLGVQANYAWDQNIHDSGWLLSSTLFTGYRNTYRDEYGACYKFCGLDRELEQRFWSGGVEVLQTYQFIWGDFFNLNLGYGGMMTIGNTDTSQLKSLEVGFHPNAELSVGWRL